MTDVAYREAAHALGAGTLAPPRRRAAHPVARVLEGRWWTAVRALTDLTALGAAIAFAASSDGSRGVLVAALLAPLAALALARAGLYGERAHRGILDEVRTVAEAVSLAAVVAFAAVSAVDAGATNGGAGVRAWLVATAGVCTSRLVLAAARREARVRRLVATPALIVGAGEVAGRIARIMTEQRELGLTPVGFVDGESGPLLSEEGALERVLAQTEARHVVVAFSNEPDAALIPLVQRCRMLGVRVSVVPRLFERVGWRAELDHAGPLPLLALHPVDPKGWQFATKHALDRTVAALVLALLAPFMLVLALAVRASSPGPVMFRQWRVGRDGRPFLMLKFRTMRQPAASADGALELPPDCAPGGVEGEDRRTAVGALLRRTSLDELPQLINVLKGEMSLVGPRPERPEFVELLGQEVHAYDERHRVKGGITGLAQVYGLRGKTSVMRRIEWDNHYIENWSLWLDFKILVMTIGAVLRGSE